MRGPDGRDAGEHPLRVERHADVRPVPDGPRVRPPVPDPGLGGPRHPRDAEREGGAGHRPPRPRGPGGPQAAACLPRREAGPDADRHDDRHHGHRIRGRARGTLGRCRIPGAEDQGGPRLEGGRETSEGDSPGGRAGNRIPGGRERRLLLERRPRVRAPPPGRRGHDLRAAGPGGRLGRDARSDGVLAHPDHGRRDGPHRGRCEEAPMGQRCARSEPETDEARRDRPDGRGEHDLRVRGIPHDGRMHGGAAAFHRRRVGVRPRDLDSHFNLAADPSSGLRFENGDLVASPAPGLGITLA